MRGHTHVHTLRHSKRRLSVVCLVATTGAIGDAFADLNQLEDALNYYEQAARLRTNSFTTPLFLFKAGNTALELGKSDKALKMFERIDIEFPKSNEAKDIAIYISKARYSN